MDTKFFAFVWRHSKREQIIILALTFLSFPLVYISLEIPKIIVNDAIDGTDFPRVFLGIEFGQVPYLLLLCFAFLLMVVLINAIKWFLNVTIGMTGERMLRRLRFLLFEHVMRFRMRRFRTTKPGEVIQSMLGEIEPLGGFFGEVVATPAFQGGLLCVYVTFIFMQDLWLGLAAISLYPLQAWLIPRLQAKVVRLNKERAGNTRVLADTISESVSQIADIHTNDTARWHMAQVSGRLHSNTLIRMAIFKRKFTIKFVNNFLNQLTPFLFYSAGGYLVIRGDLDFGSLVAVLAAYKDLAGPWKEVLNYVQRWSDFNGRYVYVVESFIGDDVQPPERVWSDAEREVRLDGDLTLERIDGGPGTGGLSVDEVRIPAGQSVAISGDAAVAREALVRIMGALSEPVRGSVRLGGQSLADATLSQIGRSLAFVSPEPGIVNRSMRENLIYGLLARAPDLGGLSSDEAQQMQREAKRTGNILADPSGDWVDYAAAGVSDADGLELRLFHLIDRFGLADDLRTRALQERIDPEDADRWTGPVMAARDALGHGTPGQDLSGIVEPWDRERFNGNATLLENLLFALPVDARGDIGDIALHADVLAILEASGGKAELERIGWEIAREFHSLVDSVDRESGVLDGFPGYSRAEVLAAADLAAEHQQGGLQSLEPAARRTLLCLAARFVLRRDRLDVIDEASIARILGCRRKAQDAVHRSETFVSFDETRFNPALTIAENIVGAKRRYDRRAAWRELDERMERAIGEAGLRADLLRLGLAAPAGAGGSNLSGHARRRIGLIRAVIKRPSLIVLDGVAGSGSEGDMALRGAIRDEVPGVTLIWATDTPDAMTDADRQLTVSESGSVTSRDAGEGRQGGRRA